MLETIRLLDLRGYATLDASFGPGPQLVWGPNAAGKTSLLEAMVLLAWGRSHRTSADGELIRWGTDLARVEGRRRDATPSRSPSSGPARPGPPAASGSGSTASPRRAAGLGGHPAGRRSSRPRRCSSSPARRRSAGRSSTSSRSPARRPTPTPSPRTAGRSSSATACSGRSARRAPSRDELRFWDGAFLDAGGAIVAERRRLLATLAEPLAAAHAEIAPDEAAAGAADPALRDERAATPRGVATGRARAAPGRDGREGGLERLDARRAASRRPRRSSSTAATSPAFASRGQQRTAILAFKLAELDLRDRARRPPAAPPPRRRLLRARSGAPLAPRPADRGPAPGVRDDDDARRPRPGAARDRDGLGGARRSRRRRAWSPPAATRRRRP